VNDAKQDGPLVAYVDADGKAVFVDEVREMEGETPLGFPIALDKDGNPFVDMEATRGAEYVAFDEAVLSGKTWGAAAQAMDAFSKSFLGVGRSMTDFANAFVEAMQIIKTYVRLDPCGPKSHPDEIRGKFYREHIGYPQLPSVQLQYRREWRRCHRMYHQTKMERLPRSQRNRSG
jgi:hypothetical protein